MDYTENVPVDRASQYAAIFAKASLFIYVFFLIFGTRVPFIDQIKDVEQITTANPINQFVYSSLYIISFLCLLLRKDQFFQLVKKKNF